MAGDPIQDVGHTLELLLARQGGTETFGQTVREVVDIAVVTVLGAETAGITVLRADGAFESLAVTDDAVRDYDRVQFDLNEGPCLAAIVDEPIFSIADTHTEQRWPAFVAAVAKLGVRSMLACRLATSNGTVASLNFHSSAPDAFDQQAVVLAAVSSAQASVALATAEVNDSLRAAMGTRQNIGEACGVMMERHGLTSKQAFGLLVKVSQQLNVKLREVADHIVATGAEPESLRTLVARETAPAETTIPAASAPPESTRPEAVQPGATTPLTAPVRIAPPQAARPKPGPPKIAPKPGP